MFCCGIVDVVAPFRPVGSDKVRAKQQSITRLQNADGILLSESELLEWRICVALSIKVDVIIFLVDMKISAMEEHANCRIGIGISKQRKSWIGNQREPVFGNTFETNE